MNIIYLLLSLMSCQAEIYQSSRETISELITRLELELQEWAVAVRQLAVPLPESQFQQLAEAIIRQRVPVHAKTEECRAHSNLLVNAIIRGESWALRMFDASSKLQSGILYGNLIDFGHHRQCVRVEEPHHLFKGQHCLVEIRNLLPKELHLHFNYDKSDIPQTFLEILPHATDLGFSLCVPSTCSARDIQAHMNHVLAPINASSVLYDSSCSTNQPVPLRPKDWFAIAVFCGIAMLVSWATIKHLHSPCNQSVLVTSFSLRHTWRQLTNVQTNTEDISCMAGIRIISTVSVVFCHCFLKHLWDPSVSPLTVEQELSSYHILWVEISGRSIEVFFILGGITRALSFLRERANEKPYEFLAPILRRYFRYTPTLAVVMLFSATFLMRCGSGPFWTRSTNFSVWGCCNLWFTGILHISNLIYPQAACVGHSWYLAIDFQLFLVSPLFLFQLHYDPRVGLMTLAAIAAASLFAHLLVAIAISVDGPSLAFLYKSRMRSEIVTEIYFSTAYRLSPYMLGLALGYFIFKAKQDNRGIKMTKAVLWTGWIASLVTVLGVLYTSKIMLDPRYQRIPWLDIGYIVLGKQLLGVVVGWVVMVCHFGYGGVLNDFLSWRGFQLLSKLALGIYLTHFDIIRIQTNRQTSSIQYDNFYLFHIGLGALVISSLVAVVLYLCVESPFYSLISYYLRPTATTTNVATTIKIDKPYQLLATSNVDTMMTKKQRRARKITVNRL